MEGIIAVLALFGVPGIWLLGKTDIGEAIVERIRHGTHAAGSEELLAEVDDLRVRLAEMEQRLDFAERTLASGSGARRFSHDSPV